jgi:hypothetical protein
VIPTELAQNVVQLVMCFVTVVGFVFGVMLGGRV